MAPGNAPGEAKRKPVEAGLFFCLSAFKYRLRPRRSGLLDDDADSVEKDISRRRAYLADPVVELRLRHFQTRCKFGVSADQGRCTLKRSCVIRQSGGRGTFLNHAWSIAHYERCRKVAKQRFACSFNPENSPRVNPESPMRTREEMHVNRAVKAGLWRLSHFPGRTYEQRGRRQALCLGKHAQESNAAGEARLPHP